MGKGTNTTTSTSAPSPQAMDAYNSLLNRAGGVASTPYQSYTGQLQAPVNAQQYSGIGNINQNAGFAQPYIQQAAQYANNAAQPLTAAQIQQYQNPYTSQVVGATEQQFNNQNAIQQQQVLGNAAAQGALGGDRVGIAQAVLAGQQASSEAPVIAGLESQGYQQGVQTAEQQQQNQAMGAYSLGNLGVSGQNAALTGANAQIGAGTLEQQTEQAALAAQYGQFQQAQAFPYQQTQWLAGIDTGVGSQLGGTSTTTGPQPNPLSSILGLGVAGLGVAGGLGWQPFGQSSGGTGQAHGGRVAGFADGGMANYPQFGGGYGSSTVMPFGEGKTWIPGSGITRGQGAPRPPGVTSPQGLQIPGLGNIGATFKRGSSPNTGISTDPAGAGFPLEGSADADALSRIVQTTPEGFGVNVARGGPIVYFRGGRIPGFAVGGAPVPEPNVGYSGSDIDASDIVMNGGPGGLGLGAPYEPTNAALAADRAYMPDGSPAPAYLPPEITQGRSGVGHGVGSGGYNFLDADADRPPATPISGLARANAGPSRGDAPATKEGGFGFQITPALSQGLMAAGFGMMASRSPFVGEAIGQGGLQGLSAYTGAQQREFTQEQQQEQKGLEGRRIELESQRLAQEADRQAKALEIQSGHLNIAQQNLDFNKQKFGSGIFSPDVIDKLSDQALAGDKTWATNLGRGAQGPENIAAVREAMARKMTERGISGSDQAAIMANFAAQTAAASVAAKRESTVSMAVEEAKATFPLALQRSEELPRSAFVPWNKAVQMVQAGTSSPELARFVTANQGVITAYSQAMSRTGTNSVNAQQHAESLLSTATSPEAYRAVIEQMQQEMQAAQVAPDLVRKHILDSIKNPGAAVAAPVAGGAPAGKPDAAARYKQLTANGVSEADAYAQMHKEGY